MATTTKGIQYPSQTDPPDGAGQMRSLAETADSAIGTAVAAEATARANAIAGTVARTGPNGLSMHFAGSSVVATVDGTTNVSLGVAGYPALVSGTTIVVTDAGGWASLVTPFANVLGAIGTNGDLDAWAEGGYIGANGAASGGALAVFICNRDGSPRPSSAVRINWVAWGT